MNRTIFIRFTLLFLAALSLYQVSLAQNSNGLINQIRQQTNQAEQRLNQVENLILQYDQAIATGNAEQAGRIEAQLQNRINRLLYPIQRLSDRAAQLGNSEINMGANELNNLQAALANTFNVTPGSRPSNQQGIDLVNQAYMVIDGCIRRELQDIGT